MGQFDSACAAYLSALKLRPDDGKVEAMYGYCLGRMGHDQDAIGYDNAAIEAGFETAVVYNNRGYSLYVTKMTDEAQEDLSKALKLDPTLQAPHFNLALLAEARALKDSNQKSVCETGILHIREALKIGPKRADLYYHGAILYTLASDWDRALAYLQEAIELGLHHGQLEDAAFQPLREHSRYKKLKALPSRQFEPEPTPNLVDPVRD
jgi:tetratricopeptide (TPR) repeat protein